MTIDDQRDYPLTIVAVDGLGDECYRTQLDWSGFGRDLSNVPSRDLNERRPRWESFQVIDAHGKVRYSGSNDDAGRDGGDLLEMKRGDAVRGTVKADELGRGGGRGGDAGDLQAEDPRADVKESAKESTKAGSQQAGSEQARAVDEKKKAPASK